MKATIKIMGKEYHGEGKTIAEALENISYTGFSRFKSMLMVNGKTVVLIPQQTQRLFSPVKMVRDIAIKNLSLRF
jgi:hypothetical protein